MGGQSESSAAERPQAERAEPPRAFDDQLPGQRLACCGLAPEFEVGSGEVGSGERPDADEVEARVVQATRKLGRQTIEHWAHEEQERALSQCRAAHPDAKLKKKAH